MGRFGTVTERKDADGNSFSPRRWRVIVRLGRDPVTGKYKQVERTVAGTKAEAEEELVRMHMQRTHGVKMDAQGVTFQEFADNWHQKRLGTGNYATRTMQAEEMAVRRLNRYLGSLKLRDIDPLTVENALFRLQRDTKGKRGEHITQTSLLRYHRVLSQIMKKAVAMRLTYSNPCQYVDAPKKDTKEKEPLSAEQLRKLHAALGSQVEECYTEFAEKEQRMGKLAKTKSRSRVDGVSTISLLHAVALGLATGMRLGEVLALRWCDVAKDCSSLTVNQTIVCDGELKEPKTKKSRRTIALDAGTAEQLRKWKRFQHGALCSLGLDAVRNAPVITSNAGTYIWPRNFERWWRKWADKNVVQGFTFHQLRHTHASQLLANGVDVKTVQERLGHSSAATTLDIYAHALPENDRGAAELFERIMNAEAAI